MVEEPLADKTALGVVARENMSAMCAVPRLAKELQCSVELVRGLKPLSTVWVVKYCFD